MKTPQEIAENYRTGAGSPGARLEDLQRTDWRAYSTKQAADRDMQGRESALTGLHAAVSDVKERTRR